MATLETACRQKELLDLQWRYVDLVNRKVTIIAENAKGGESRVLPISTRLAAVLEMANRSERQEVQTNEHVSQRAGGRTSGLDAAL